MNKLPPLRFHNGSFRIMVVGDLHEPYDLTDPDQSRRTADELRLLNAALDAARPDLVVFAGDQGKDDNEEKERRIAQRILAPLKKRGVPYALVYGNHDPECAVPLSRQMEIWREEYCRMYVYNADPALPGWGNCRVSVKDGGGKKDVLNLWFMDSLSRCENAAVSYYDWLRAEQLDWYKKTAAADKAANGGRTVPALWFMHIPVPEERLLMRRARFWELPRSVKGFGSRAGHRYVPADRSIGYVGEDPACAEINSGIFGLWKEVGDVKGAFFGHDHMNAFAGRVDGILLAQCKTASFHVYTDGCNGGVRLIDVPESDPAAFTTRMLKFKELGLKSESLGFVQRHFTDREGINAHVAFFGSLLTAAGAGAALLIKKSKKAE